MLEVDAVAEEALEGEEAGRRAMPTAPSSVTEGEGETGDVPRAHLLEDSRQGVSPPGPVTILTGGTGRGQGTGTGDPAPLLMEGSPVPMTGQQREGPHLHRPMTGLPRRTTGLPRLAGLHLPMTALPQATLLAGIPQPMTGHHLTTGPLPPPGVPLLTTGRQATLPAELPLPMTGPAPLTTGGRRRPPG